MIKNTEEFIVVFVTAKDTEEAQRISRGLLEKKLIACTNIIPAVSSLFWWKGKIDRSSETLVVMKAQKRLFPKIDAAVKKAHSYSVPEIIALPIVDGSQDYLKWVKESTG